MGLLTLNLRLLTIPRREDAHNLLTTFGGYSYNIQRHCVYFNSFLYNKSYLYCCLFQVQELGLQQAYRNDRGTHNLVRKLLALPFLPADEIPNAFHRLEAKAATEPLQALAQYINNTWISSTTWHPSCWSVFQQSVRTNNDRGMASRAESSHPGEITASLLPSGCTIIPGSKTHLASDPACLR